MATETATVEGARTRSPDEEGQGAEDRHAVVAVAGRRGDRALLPVPVLLARQHLAQDGAGPLESSLVPPNPSLANYESIFKNDDFMRALLNSVIVSLVTTVLSLIVGSFCAYALARLRFKGKFLILATVLSITTFPAIAIAAPIFKLWTDLGHLQHAVRA